MAKASTQSKREIMKTICRDCIEEPEDCGKDPLECKEKAEIYFSLYDQT